MLISLFVFVILLRISLFLAERADNHVKKIIGEIEARKKRDELYNQFIEEYELLVDGDWKLIEKEQQIRELVRALIRAESVYAGFNHDADCESSIAYLIEWERERFGDKDFGDNLIFS